MLRRSLSYAKIKKIIWKTNEMRTKIFEKNSQLDSLLPPTEGK